MQEMFLQKLPESVRNFMAHLQADWLERWGHSAVRRFQEKIFWHEDCWLWNGEPLSARERLLLVRRFGLDGQAPQTLDVLIAPLGVTKWERVRQIEGQALRKLQLPTQRQALRAKLDQLTRWGE